MHQNRAILHTFQANVGARDPRPPPPPPPPWLRYCKAIKKEIKSTSIQNYKAQNAKKNSEKKNLLISFGFINTFPYSEYGKASFLFLLAYLPFIQSFMRTSKAAICSCLATRTLG